MTREPSPAMYQYLPPDVGRCTVEEWRLLPKRERQARLEALGGRPDPTRGRGYIQCGKLGKWSGFGYLCGKHKEFFRAR